MAKNTIGQFIAALRKANGLTQQEVADRLHVSNKAVSRWERDECAPDLSVIPALAEMFGVTCDELLKGERIAQTEAAERKKPKVEKQARNLVYRTLSGFRTLIWISLAASAVGLVCMFGISYGFYRPVIGFAVMLLFEVCACVLAVFALNRARDVKACHELFEMADEALVSKFNATLGNLSFAAFFGILAVVLLSLPLILIRSDLVDSVLSINSYFTGFFGGIALLLALVYAMCKKPYMHWLITGELLRCQAGPADTVRKKMTAIQAGVTLAGAILFVIAPYFEYYSGALNIAVNGIGLGCLLANVISLAVFLAREREYRRYLLLPGVRNALMIPSALIVTGAHTTGMWYGPGETTGVLYERWYPEYFLYALALAAVVWIVFALIETAAKRRQK